MLKNMGSADRVIRIAFTLLIAILFFTDQISGIAAIILGLFAVILLLTGLVGFCPLYFPFKINTTKNTR